MEVPKCFYFNLLVLATSFFFTAVSAIDPYTEALLGLKSELADDYSSLNDWVVPSGDNPTGKPYACSWSGVKCNKNSTIVIALDLSLKKLGGLISGRQFNVFTELVDLNLSHNAFSGQLPAEIFNLTNLRSLDISRNNFSGHFPAGISGLHNLVVLDAFSNSFSGLLPVEIGKLEYLKVLNLAGSYFKGAIPSEYGSFKSLEFLHLAGNLISGNIPAELGKLKTVTHMEIGYNFYEGVIPWQLGNMSKLEYLDIAGANLSGAIPKQLANLTKLQSLFLFRNQLSGPIPWELSKIETLKNLDLSDNQISGSIPESFEELKNLRLLSLMYNEMNGTVPEGIARLPSLETLLIWNNFFSGSLPQSLGRNSKLMWVDVSTNNFVGSIPPDICIRGVLYKLILFSNNFNGSLSPSLTNCSSLVRLRLEDNSFSGEISLSFSHLPDISYVDLSRNNFNGGIPSDISIAKKLQYFNISSNPELGGTIPPQTWSLPLLQNFSASSCRISGALPPFESCKSISVLELGMNNLIGIFPESVSNCQALSFLDLSNNSLSGHIPQVLANLPALAVVDLSHNDFSGPIPAKFESSSNLQILNVSFNHISGSIPTSKVFKIMGSSAFVGNQALCGAPLRPCPDSVAILGSKGTGKLVRLLLLFTGVLIFLAASVFAVLYFQRGMKSQWKIMSFAGLPRFTAKDILRSFSTSKSTEEVLTLSPSICKAVLPTGITVLVKKIEWEGKSEKFMSEFVTRLGNTRHKNLIRLLGFCYNKHLIYLLYDYLPNGNLAEKIRMKQDWEAKYKTVVGIAKGLCFLHHDCYPAIPHGNLKLSNIVFDENMEPHLAEFGFKHVLQLSKGSLARRTSGQKTGEFNEANAENLYMDVYNFGEILLQILTDGRLTNEGTSVESKTSDDLLREIDIQNQFSSSNSLKEEVKQVLDVVLLCTKSRPADRPSMEHVMKLLSRTKPPEDGKSSRSA